MYQNYYHEQLAEISTCVKYLKDTYDRYILPRYFLLLCFGNLNSRDYDSDSLGMLCCPGFLTVSYRFPWCFRMFPPAFLRFPLVFLLFPLGVSPVSILYFALFHKVWRKCCTVYQKTDLSEKIIIHLFNDFFDWCLHNTKV